METDKVAVHPNYLHEKSSSTLSCNKDSSHTHPMAHPVADNVIDAGTENNMCVECAEDTDTLSTASVAT